MSAFLSGLSLVGGGRGVETTTQGVVLIPSGFGARACVNFFSCQASLRLFEVPQDLVVPEDVAVGLGLVDVRRTCLLFLKRGRE